MLQSSDTDVSTTVIFLSTSLSTLLGIVLTVLTSSAERVLRAPHLYTPLDITCQAGMQMRSVLK